MHLSLPGILRRNHDRQHIEVLAKFLIFKQTSSKFYDRINYLLKLKEVLASGGKGLQVKTDTPEEFYLKTNKQVHSKDFFFGAVYQKPNHVSFHLFPLYTNPELKEELSEDVRKTLQGKNCFTFKKELSEKAFTELRELTRKGYQKFVESGYIDPK